jgi:long-chain acyl-CoA synthetase
MTFLDDIFARLKQAGQATVLEELRDGAAHGVTAAALLQRVEQARAFLRSQGLKKGERCALLAPNSIDWVAVDLAIMAEGLIVVPLYSRQAPAELAAMVKDCGASLICASDADLRDGLAACLATPVPAYLFVEIFAGDGTAGGEARAADNDPVAIIYTSGTSGEAKGVVQTAANIGHMLVCTSGRLDLLMEGRSGQDRVFHYLPLCFAGSWILLLTSLLRASRVALNTDLSKIAADMRAAAPDYFLNVPALLERMRKAVDEQLWKTGSIVQVVYSKAKGAWARKHDGHSRAADALWLALGNTLVFPAIRKKMIGANLRALICGSAPLNVETQLFFQMLGIRVLQGYGLTETTALCTLDDPRRMEPGRVGPAIAGVEMKLGENDEILARGPNIFPGYWNRPQETAKVLRDCWFHTGDQGEVDATGNWKIVGRIKNLIILGSGHNIAPEPIEEMILAQLPGAQQVVLVGNGRGYLSALVTGGVSEAQMQAALDAVNPTLPHYKQVRAFRTVIEPFSIENGLLTANGKLKRDLIAQRYQAEIEGLYQQRQAS